MEKTPNKPAFANRVRELRKQRRDGRRGLAKAIGVSLSYISFLENAKDGRLPSRHVANAIADYFKLSQSERNDLLEVAGHVGIPAQAHDIQDEIQRIVTGSGLHSREMELLVREIKSYALRWTRQREARQKEVKKAIIVAAGWQARLLAPEKFETTILHAAQEAIDAEIHHIVVVVAPLKSAPRFDRVRELARARKADITLSVVTQEEPLGLGDAIQCTREVIGEEPFAVILPVDVDATLTATKEMKRVYKIIQKPLLAVANRGTLTKTELQHYGLALLGGKMGLEGAEKVRFVTNLQEKPRGATAEWRRARVIMGRYILTPDIFDVLQETPKNSVTKNFEITDALAALVDAHHFVCAYPLEKPLLSLAPVRAVMEMLVESVTLPATLAKMINITRNAVDDLQRITASRRG